MNISALIAPDVSGVLASRGTPGTRRVRRDISSALYPAASRGFVRRPSAPRLSSCRSSFAGNAMLSLAARVVADSSRRRRLTVRADAGELYGRWCVPRPPTPNTQTFKRQMRFYGKSADADQFASPRAELSRRRQRPRQLLHLPRAQGDPRADRRDRPHPQQGGVQVRARPFPPTHAPNDFGSGRV